MDQDVLEPVLQEILEELKQTNKLNRENTRVLIELEKRIAAIEKRLDQKLLSPASSDNKQIERIVSENTDNIIRFIAEQPKEFVQNKRILLFPEHNAAEFYKVFYGRLFKWLAILFIACFLYALGRDYIGAYQEKNWYRDGYEQLLKEKEENSRKVKQKPRVSAGISH
ncbi:hypothetical protein GWC95_07615 [Sediminibacterium roseum]|uniref:Uncharacterized protein n=1 Tax=Sediminibacterium roseum TaxID=1978412 RepID=A0ABW9ZRP9_9BACT|nr:hypothetical protein [Sediminibacterium roseum]NCI49784.1 hypothetical protein [Sediminibacterium roseum]